MPYYEETALRIMDWLKISYPEDLVFGERRLLKQADSVSEEWVQRYRDDKKEKENSMERCSPFSISSWNFNTSDVSKIS